MTCLICLKKCGNNILDLIESKRKFLQITIQQMTPIYANIKHVTTQLLNKVQLDALN